MSAHNPTKRRISVPEIRAKKKVEPIVSLTAYHAHTAAIAEAFEAPLSYV